MILLSMQMFMHEMSNKLFYDIKAIFGILSVVNVNILLEQLSIRLV